MDRVGDQQQMELFKERTWPEFKGMRQNVTGDQFLHYCNYLRVLDPKYHINRTIV